MPLLTKSQQAENYLMEALHKGRWAPGERLPGEYEMLEELGVSRATVREALNSLARQGMIIRKPGAGTYVSQKQSLTNVAIVARATQLSPPVGHFYRSMVELSQRQIGDAGYRALVSVGSGASPEEFLSSMHLFDREVLRSLKGVFSLVCNDKMASLLEREGVSCVDITGIGSYSVYVDLQQAFHMAIDALVSHGHEDFVVMHMKEQRSPLNLSYARLCEHIEGLRQHAVNGDRSRLVGVPFSVDYSYAYEAFKEWWSLPNRPRAIFFEDDGIFDVASRAIVELGIKVPEELAVITTAMSGREFHFPVEVARAEWDNSEIVSAAWKMLDKRMDGEAIDEPHVKIPVRLREGGSL